jgi:hypothetical protein
MDQHISYGSEGAEWKGKVDREVSTILDAEPLETKFFSVPVTGDEDIGTTDWNIERAFGYKSDEAPTSSGYKFRVHVGGAHDECQFWRAGSETA